MSRVLAPGEEECEQRVGEKSLLLETQRSEDEGEDGAAAVLLGLEGRAPEERDGRADGGEGGQGLEGGDEGVCVVQGERVLISWDDMQREKRMAERKEK